MLCALLLWWCRVWCFSVRVCVCFIGVFMFACFCVLMLFFLRVVGVAEIRWVLLLVLDSLLLSVLWFCCVFGDVVFSVFVRVFGVCFLGVLLLLCVFSVFLFAFLIYFFACCWCC